ncbi:DUF7342 family protein [Halococcus agarilyticus]|uniref:DUF7342 family protein n=1 Tax=Halococcus agarilyticus TaxID=1232219 RepID=UPI000677AF09|nr:hypothetical protein [Halococcus agarilyticus]
MDDPRPELKGDERAETPIFESLTPPDELVRSGRTRDDFFDAVLGLESPATIGEVADRADHGRDAAKEYLEWFERMGIVTQVTESPATYERNREYLTWRRVQQLRNRYTTDELLEFLKTATERDQMYMREFDVESPDGVPISAHASDTDQSLESVWDDVSMWKTTRRRIALLERALVSDSDDSADQRTTA